MATDTQLTGPIAVTGADGHVGRALQRRLADLPNRVTALSRIDDWTPAIRASEVVIHLAGTLQPERPNSYEAANVGTMERLVDAATDSTVRKVVFLSYVGADPGSANAYLRTKGQAEDLLGASGVPHVVFRSTFVYGEPDDIGPSFASYHTRAGGKVSVLGDGRQRLAPIHVDDLTALLVAAALDMTTPHGTFEVSGPESFTLDDFIMRINPAGVKVRHVPPPMARLLARFMRRLTPALVDVLLTDSLAEADPIETARRFGVTLHVLDDVTET